MRRLILIGAILAGSAAQAQDLRYSNQGTVDCLVRTTSDLNARRACVGISANSCMAATPDGSTTYGRGACLDQELQLWDGWLNITYKELRGKAINVDAGAGQSGSSTPRVSDALRDAQRAWIVWRDATCNFERAQWGNGSGGGPATLACLLRLTGDQAIYLEQAWFGE